MSLAFPYEMKAVEKTTQEKLKKRFLAYSEGLVQVQPNGFVMPAHYSKFAAKYYNFEFRSDDVVIMTHPKCGTTWTQEIVWTMRNGLDTSTSLPLDARSPFLEFDSLEAPYLEPHEGLLKVFKARNPDGNYRNDGVYLDLAQHAPSPRTIKTHLPFSLVNPKLLDTCKVIYVARNPKDAVVSYFHHQRLVMCSEFIGDFAEFLDYWCKDLITQNPYWEHVREGWAQRDHPNVLFLFYEDMKEDSMRELSRLNTFLGTSLTQEQLQTVANHTTFSNMKTRPTSNPTKAAVKAGHFKEGEQEFVRKGTTGGWSDYFTPELEMKFQAWMDTWKHVAKDVPFRYKIY